MGHLELFLFATSSYLASLWFIARWRRWRRQPATVSVIELRRPHLARALAPLFRPALAADPEGRQRSELLAALEAGDLTRARALQRSLEEASLPPAPAALLRAALEVTAAAQAPSALARHRHAVRSRRAARRAREIGLEAVYLEVLVLLGFLSDGFTEDLRLWQSKRLLGSSTTAASGDPLLQLAAALQCAVSGETAEAVAALARAFYHARDDRFVAEIIVRTPFVAELSPSLIEEASRALP